MAYKLDIREVLRQLDRRQFDYFAGLSEDARKGFAPPVVLRWMSAVSGPQAETMLWMVNEIANIHYHDLYGHPELQFRLLASCGGGVALRHEWVPSIKPPKRRSIVHEFLEELHPSANDFELDLLFADLTLVELQRLLDDCAITADRSKMIVNAFKKA